MSKDNAIKQFHKSSAIQSIRTTAEKYYDTQMVDETWQKAEKILHELMQEYPEVHHKVQSHLDSILPHIAIYKALQQVVPDSAMKIMEEGEAKNAKQHAVFFQRMVNIPFGKTIFLKGFAAGCKTGFGSDAGFENKVYIATNTEYKMDITKCPYVDFCSKYGCAELTHIFCDNDEYMYGNLDGIVFERKGTLGKDDAQCDFYLRRK